MVTTCITVFIFRHAASIRICCNEHLRHCPEAVLPMSCRQHWYISGHQEAGKEESLGARSSRAQDCRGLPPPKLERRCIANSNGEDNAAIPTCTQRYHQTLLLPEAYCFRYGVGNNRMTQNSSTCCVKLARFQSYL